MLIHVKDKPVNDWYEALSHLKMTEEDWVTTLDIAKGYKEGIPWRSGLEIEVFGATAKNGELSTEIQDRILEVLPQISINFCYCSMYNECHEFHYNRSQILDCWEISHRE
jgi:hypothetical protein